jgi:molybdate/tungstate transport system substrate-binding protein
MQRTHTVLRASLALLAMPAAVSLVMAQGAAAQPTTTTTQGSANAQGSVNVLYAGSLQQIMEDQLGPAFTHHTGYAFQGFGAGSTALAQQIKGGVRQGDVFVSASSKADQLLVGKSNGGWVTYYVSFAKSPLVLGYNPNSSFAAALRTKPWTQVVTSPGFRLGRTDPQLDPKGVLTVKALDEVATKTHTPALANIANDTGTVFPEEALVGRLQAGQLDAGFFYKSEARAAGIPTVSVAPAHLFVTYTVTTLAHSPHPAAARAFVKYLLSPATKKAMTADGLQLITHVTKGSAPAWVRSTAPTG